MTEPRLLHVGGSVRDELDPLHTSPPKDHDFTVDLPSFAALIEWVESFADAIHKVDESTLTVRCKVSKELAERFGGRDLDFVCFRKESSESNGRRPDKVEVGTLETDLARRDFTVNAMARELGSTVIIDPHGGQDDLATRTLRFVGDPLTRVREDGLRVLRGFRFMVTKRLVAAPETWEALCSEEAARLLAGEGKAIAVHRIFEELEKMLRHDTPGSLLLLASLPDHTRAAMFRDGLHLAPSMKGK